MKSAAAVCGALGFCLALGCASQKPAEPPKLEHPLTDKPVAQNKPVSGLPLELDARSRALVEALATRDFARVVRELDPKMSSVLDANKLELAWRTSTAALGAPKASSDVRRERKQGHDVITVTRQFERGALDVKLVFDAERRISGLWLAPAWSPPAYVATERFSERELTIGQAPWALPGTLALPNGSGPVAAIVLVHGSGPHDRDETLGPNKPFKDLAWGLASRGIAVLRYDKRTRVHLDKIRGSKQPFTVNDETIDDALAAAELVRTTAGIDPARVFVLGHSMGGALLPRIGARDAKLAGLIALAAAATPSEASIVAQFRYIFELDGKIDESEKKKLSDLEAQAAKVRALKPGDSGEPIFGAPPAYWLDLRGYDPAEAAKKLRQPLFFAQGARDYQVTRKDFERFKSALKGRKNVQFRWYEPLNHLFMSGQGPITPDEYERAGHVELGVIEDVVRFVEKPQ